MVSDVQSACEISMCGFFWRAALRLSEETETHCLLTIRYVTALEAIIANTMRDPTFDRDIHTSRFKREREGALFSLRRLDSLIREAQKEQLINIQDKPGASVEEE